MKLKETCFRKNLKINKMKVLVTGAGGFIGFHLCNALAENKIDTFGLDNFNKYYDVNLKKNRIKILKKKNYFKFSNIDILKKNKLFAFIKKNKITTIVHLAAQAGVRYSLTNPKAYIDNNINGFFNILESCKKFKIKKLLFASSSSVYGLNEKLPYKEDRIADHPIQLYAATKRSNELMAHAYSHLYNIDAIGLRLFTVYGPWGRPDMSLFKFTRNILNSNPVELYNHGNHSRDFTYIDDAIKILIRLLKFSLKPNLKWHKKENDPSTSSNKFKILNVSCGQRIPLRDFVKEIEKNLKLKAKIKLLPLQQGDIVNSFSSKKNLKKYIKIPRITNYKQGVKKFILWYLDYYKKKK
jgi:UDP-glucuronate 4-epimerase